MENLLYGLFYERNGSQIYKICSPVNGQVLDQSVVRDKLISNGDLGQSFAVMPDDGYFVSPFNGTVTDISEFGEKISLKSDEGLEILIRVGEGADVLKGKGIFPKVKKGTYVLFKENIANISLDIFRLNGISPLSTVTLTNSDNYSQFTVFQGKCVAGVSEIMMFTSLKENGKNLLKT